MTQNMNANLAAESLTKDIQNVHTAALSSHKSITNRQFTNYDSKRNPFR